MTADRLSEIRARASAATPGPWGWRGNIDWQCPSLRAPHPRFGWTEVLGHVKVERTADDPRVRDVSDYFDEAETKEVIDEFLTDPYGEKRTDDRLAFVTDGMLVEARKLARFKVAPQATERTDPSVYRADIIGLRHPDAEFIQHSRADVEWLLAEVDRLRAALAALQLDSGTHTLGCAMWEAGDPDACDCEPANLAEAPTMRGALEQSFGDPAAPIVDLRPTPGARRVDTVTPGGEVL